MTTNERLEIAVEALKRIKEECFGLPFDIARRALNELNSAGNAVVGNAVVGSTIGEGSGGGFPCSGHSEGR